MPRQAATDTGRTGWSGSQQAETVRAQVLRLPESYRTAMVLYYFQEQDVAETARILGLGEGTLKGRLHRGRELLSAGCARSA